MPLNLVKIIENSQILWHAAKSGQNPDQDLWHAAKSGQNPDQDLWHAAKSGNHQNAP